MSPIRLCWGLRDYITASPSRPDGLPRARHENGVCVLEFEISGFTLGWPGSDDSDYHTQEDRIHEREVGPVIRKN
jgi:hypothetical protein